MAIVHAIGMPENKSERDTIAYFKEHLPDNYFIFHSLELPNSRGLPYEYDIIVVGDEAVYMVEVKGYQGLIKGNAQEWELEPGTIYKSPIPLANKKAKVLGSLLGRYSPLLSQVWTQSLIVLSDDRARVRINDPQSDKVLHLDEAVAFMLDSSRLPVRPTRMSNLMLDLTAEAIFKRFRPLRRQSEIGDYHIIETIEKNNLYTTLLAEHRLIRTQGRFTLKVYSFDIYSSDETRRKQEEWMLRDANALHRLGEHPNIVRAHLPFPWQANQYILPVEWVDGYSLRGLLDSDAKIGFSRAIDIVRQVGEALRYAHTNGVIHRDVQPDNIIVPHEGSIKLVNFDCARVEGDDMRTIATRIGRQLDERYVAPEVWVNAGTASSASDLYALGTVFFELLTGKPPYDSIRDLFANKGLLQLPTDIDSTLPGDVDLVIGRMCAFKPEDRYPTFDEVLEDLAIIA